MSEYLTTRELATALNVSPATIGDWVRQGKIPVIVIGRTRRYRLEDVVSSASRGVRPGVRESGADVKRLAETLRRERLARKAQRNAKR